MVPSAQALLSEDGHLLKPEHEAAVDAILAGSDSDAGARTGLNIRCASCKI
jgi:hypothetical protein